MLVKFEIEVPASKLAAIMQAIEDVQIALPLDEEPKKAKAPKAKPLPAVANDVKVSPAIQPEPPVAAPEPPVAAPEPPVAAPEPEPEIDLELEPAGPKHTAEDVKNLVLQISAEKRISIVQGLFDSLGVKKLSDVPADKIDWMYAEVHKFFE